MIRTRRRAGAALGLSSLVIALLGAVGVSTSAVATPSTPAAHRPLPAVSAAQATAALEHAQALFSGNRHTARAVQASHGDATIVLRDLRAAYFSLSPSQRQQADRILARPSTSSSDSALVAPYAAAPSYVCSTTVNICVHYVTTVQDPTNGVDPTNDGAGNPVGSDGQPVPNYVALVLNTLVHIYGVYKNAGYRMPLDDTSSGTQGGDNPNGKTDVYLGDLSAGLYGYCTSDDPNSQTNSPSTLADSAYCVLDNDYTHTEFPTHTSVQNLQVTAAHEFFHAVQFSYDFYEDTWIMEASAVWAEDQLYTSINDNMQYLADSPISRPWLPIDLGTSPGQAEQYHWYGSWIFLRFLTERIVPTTSGGLPVLIHDIWRRLDASTASAPDQYSIQAVKTALAARGVDFTAAVNKFDLAARHPTKFFREAAANHYPTAPLGGRVKLSPSHKYWTGSVALKHLTYAPLQFHPVSGMDKTWRVRVHFDLPDKARGSAANVWINYRSGATSWRLVTLDRHGNATLTLKFGYTLINNIEVESVNASQRFAASSCWNFNATTYYSCHASHGVDDGLTSKITLTAYKS